MLISICTYRQLWRDGQPLPCNYVDVDVRSKMPLSGITRNISLLLVLVLFFVANTFITWTKVVRVDWLGTLANYKEDYNVSLFHVVCRGSRL